MNTRSVDWRDLPSLHRYRDQCVFLDNVLILTNGSIFTPAGALLSFLSPTRGVFTYVNVARESESAVLFGQVTHMAGLLSARLAFLTPQAAISGPTLSELVEQMAVEVGERGALHILAEADEQTEIYELLRQAGFGIYARQRIWKFLGNAETTKLPGFRRADMSRDLASVKFLYANLVPGLVQQVEPAPAAQVGGYVYYKGTELLAYVEVKVGPRGIWVQPFVHPDAENVVEPMFLFLKDFPLRGSRPVFLCVRSYQSWLENTLEQLAAQPGASQGVMVRHLGRRIAQTYGVLAREAATKEPAVPVAH